MVPSVIVTPRDRFRAESAIPAQAGPIWPFRPNWSTLTPRKDLLEAQLRNRGIMVSRSGLCQQNEPLWSMLRRPYRKLWPRTRGPLFRVLLGNRRFSDPHEPCSGPQRSEPRFFCPRESKELPNELSHALQLPRRTEKALLGRSQEKTKPNEMTRPHKKV